MCLMGSMGLKGELRRAPIFPFPFFFHSSTCHAARTFCFETWFTFTKKKECVSPSRAFFLVPIYFLAPATQATEEGAFALLFCPHPGGFDSSRVLTPGNLPSKAKQMPVPGGQPGREGGRGLGAAGIDWCILSKIKLVAGQHLVETCT